MSLRAKLEAVIYAAEEPVTLTQLAALFGADALEWKAAEQAAAAEQGAEVAGQPESAGPQPTLGASLEYLGLGILPGVTAVEPAEQAQAAADTAPAGELAPDVDAPAVPDAAELADAECEARRLARQRDREIRSVIQQILDELIVSFASDDRGIEIREIAGGYRMATKPECHDAVRTLVKSLKPPLRLSLPALETLAVVAYKQPVTAPEVNEIRGVESSGVLGSLLGRKLIATAGRKQVIGRPILYKTTREFLLRFGLKDLAELPSMEEFEKIAAAEFEEMEPEPAALDAAEAPAGDLVEDAAENGSESDWLAVEEDSPSGEEMAGKIAEESETALANPSAGPPAEAAELSNQPQAANQPEAAPAGAESAPAENETMFHAKEENDGQ
ncbi:MAG: SMC-Scp complex subunit ScpB [Terracidiphilus sp.]